MELPMKDEQQAPAPQAEQQGLPPAAPTDPAAQGGQQAPRQPAEGGKSRKPFPATKGEALQFSNDLLQILYDERTHANIVQQLDDVKDVAIGKGVGIVAGHVVGNRVSDVRAQTGRPLEMKLVVDAVMAVVKELGEIAAGEGFFEMNPDDQKVAVKTAVQMLDQLKEQAKNVRRPQ
jgi:hypothetical protein